MSETLVYWLLIVFSTPYYGGATPVQITGLKDCEAARELVLEEYKDNDNVKVFCIRS